MKYTVPYNVTDLDILQKSLLQEITNLRPNIFLEEMNQQIIVVGSKQNFIDKKLEEFENLLIKNFGKMLNKTFWITRPKDINSPHVDGTSTFRPKIKLMFPVLNCHRTYTTWYTYRGQLEFTNKDGIEYFFPSNNDFLNSVERVELTIPMWARVDILHGVFNPTPNIRIICSYVFEDQDKLLELFT